MATSRVLVNSQGRLVLAGGKPLILGMPGAAQPPGTTPPDTSAATSLAMVDWYMQNVSGFTSRFNIQTTAASNDTTADVPVIFTFAGGAPAVVQARVIDDNGTAVVDWTDITTSVQVSGNTCLGYLPGVSAGIGYLREVRVSASVKATDTVHFNIGWNVLPWGQSNNVGTLEGNKSGSDPVPGTALTELGYYNTNGTAAFFGEYGFVPAGTNQVSIASYSPVYAGGQALARFIGTALQSKFGRKVGVALNPWARNGTSLGQFVDTGGACTMLDNTGTVGPNIGLSSPKQFVTGDYRIVSWHQGETESGSITRAQRKADLKRFCQAHINHVAVYGRSPSQLTFLFALMGVGNPVHMEILRGAVLDLIADPTVQAAGWDVRIGWNCIDLDPDIASDGLHFKGTFQTQSLYRLAQACMHVADPVGVPKGAEGPRLTGAFTRAGSDITLTVAHSSGTGLVAKSPGSAITGWYANTAADFSGTDISLSNITIVDATHIRVTATGAPATFYIKHCGHRYYTALSYHPGVSNLIYDNFAYPTGANATEQFTGLPLQPTPDPIQVT
jgi:hypothetical protein